MNQVISMDYMAGMIDADGSIAIYKQVTAVRRNPVYRAGITVTNLNVKLLKDIQTQFGGYIANDKRNGGYAAFWYQYGQKTRQLLTELLPVLRIKRLQAEVCLEMLDMMSRQAERNGTRLLSDSDIDYRESLYLKYRALVATRNERDKGSG